MTIAYFISEYPARSHTFIRREIEEIRKHNIDIKVFSLHRCHKDEILDPQEQEEYDNTWSIFPLSASHFLIAHLKEVARNPVKYIKSLFLSFEYSEHSAKGYFYSLAYFAEAIYLLSELRAANIKSIHVHFANSGAKVSAIAANHLNLPWMISLHGSVDFEYPAILWLGSMIKNATFVRCVSYYGASQAKREVQKSEYEKIFVSYCGLPSSYTSQEPLKKTPLNTLLKLVSVGRLSPEKGQFLLLDAADNLRNRSIPFQLDIVGDGPDRQSLEQLVLELDLDQLVKFHGSVKESKALSFIAGSDIFISTSFMEGLPQVLVESMLLGTPVVAPYLAGIPELISDKVSGMLYPAGNTSVLVEKILELHSDEELFENIVQTARSHVLDQFIITHTINPLVSKTKALTSINP